MAFSSLAPSFIRALPSPLWIPRKLSASSSYFGTGVNLATTFAGLNYDTSHLLAGIGNFG